MDSMHTLPDKGSRRFLAAGILASGVALGALLGYSFAPSESDSLHMTRGECNERYSLLRADLDCTTANEDYERVARIQDELARYIDEEKKSGNATRVSVFFRDLSSRRWAAIDKNERFAPGSLLKLPLAVAYYKLSEIEPQILKERYRYEPTAASANDAEYFKPKTPLVPGKEYTVEELLQCMIADSDNEATLLLNASMDQVFLRKVISDLGITIPSEGGAEQHFITTERYATILRSLYLASYLDIEGSQRLLEVMTGATFTDGIASGLPAGTKVAHKFGERKVVDAKDSSLERVELHDCGIVYKSKRPYILCVMTEGSDYDELSRILREISKKVYDIE